MKQWDNVSLWNTRGGTIAACWWCSATKRHAWYMDVTPASVARLARVVRNSKRPLVVRPFHERLGYVVEIP